MIRLATSADATEIATLYVDIRADSVPTVHPLAEVAAYISSALISRNSSFVWVEDGGIVGWLDVHDGWVDQLYCRRGFTGSGIGKRLLEYAKTQSPEGLQLYTFQVNEGARRFYSREGFVEVELGDGSENEEGAPDVRLTWNPN